MLGLILCGGQSLRMGTDKGLKCKELKPWALVASEKLESLNFKVKLSIHAGQQKSYNTFFKADECIVDHLPLNIGGPLLGILSAHELHPEEDLFVLACDLILMDTQLMMRLLDQKILYNSFEAYVFTSDDGQEPLCGIYTSKGLKKITTELKEKGLARNSMKFVLSLLKVCEVILLNEDKKSFKNFNAPSDLEGSR